MRSASFWNHLRPQERDQTVAPLSALSAWWLLAALAPIGLTVMIIASAYTITGGQDPGFPPQFPLLIYAFANIVVLVCLYVQVGEEVWKARALFRDPSSAEVAAGVGATVLGIIIGWPLTTVVSETVGVARYTVPPLTAVVPIAVLFFGSVAVAPIAEEILYRGVFLGIGLERGYGPVVAGVGSLFVFAGIHVFTAGLGGVVNAFLLGVLLTALRLWFDNLLGAWLMHTLSNLLEFLVAISVIPSLYAL
jgi:membrane protease YdiL (CAAX protease family)